MTDEYDAELERFPRRTQRRRQTRARILRSALKLFKQVGYGGATMNAIADKADIHVTTLFTHFRTKRDLAVSLNDSAIALLERMIAEGQGKKPFFTLFREIVLDMVKTIEGESGPDLTIWHELKTDPELTFAWVGYEQQQVALFTQCVAQEYGLDPRTDYRPELVAVTMLSGAWIAHRRWSVEADRLDLVAENERALDLAERMARAVLSEQG